MILIPATFTMATVYCLCWVVGSLLLGAVAAASSPCDGIPAANYSSRGYGLALSVTTENCTLFEETQVSCIPDRFRLGSDIVQGIQNNGDQIVVSPFCSLTDLVFDRVTEFPGACGTLGVTPIKGDPSYIRDALQVFDIVDQTFVENYAFFDRRGIDWNSLTEPARSKLVSNSTDDELFEALVSILAPLDDGHVTLQTDTGKIFESKTDLAIQLLSKEFADQDEIDDFNSYVATQLERWIQIVNSYMDEDGLQGDPGGLGGPIEGFAWGQIASNRTDSPESIGYMQLLGFDPIDQVALVDELDTAFVALQDADKIVFDIRINGGGCDEIAMLVASYFTAETITAFSKQAKVPGDSGFTESQMFFIEPGDAATRFTGDVTVIISGSSVSAAEIFILAMKQLPQVTLLGRNSSGALSDFLNRVLPNAWSLTLSNEVYRDPDGIVYEVTGIPPDRVADSELLPLSEREAGIDTWLDLAIAKDETSGTSNATSEATSGRVLAGVWTTSLCMVSILFANSL